MKYVTPACAGVQGTQKRWIPVFTGMTEPGVLQLLLICNGGDREISKAHMYYWWTISVVRSFGHET